MKKTIKNIKVIIVSIVLVVIALAGLVPAFLLNYNTYSPNKPEVLDDGENIYISTSLNANYEGYRFKFKDEANKEIIIDSKNNVISIHDVLDKGIELGKTYKISTCYIAKNEGNNSDYSEETEWICQLYLSSTTISYDISKNALVWEEIENADFYRVYYNDPQGEGYIDTDQLQLDLQTFKGGEMVMYVVAYPEKANYKTSGKSNVLDFDLLHYFSEFSHASFDKNTLILTAENKELLEKLDIYVGQKIYSNIKFEIEETDNGYVYQVDLTAVYGGENVVGICPGYLDDFNLFRGVPAFVQIED